MSTTAITPGTVIQLTPMPNYEDQVLAPSTDPKSTLTENVFSIPWYQYIDRVHQVVMSLYQLLLMVDQTVTGLTEFPHVILTETGANNAIACPEGSGPVLAVGVEFRIKLAHTLQVGVNSCAYNDGPAIPIRSHFNPALNIATAYGVGGIIDLLYDGTVLQDMSQ